MASAYRCFQIVEIPAKVVPIGKATHAHPFVIYEIQNDGMYAMCISTQINTYYNEGIDFMIDKGEDGFESTGLVDDSFVRNQDFKIPCNLMLRLMGELDGELLVRFQDFLKRNDLV